MEQASPIERKMIFLHFFSISDVFFVPQNFWIGDHNSGPSTEPICLQFFREVHKMHSYDMNFDHNFSLTFNNIFKQFTLQKTVKNQ